MKSYKKMTQSHKEVDKELYDAIQDGGSGYIVDVVEKYNMNAVTSNAVAFAIPEDFPEVVDVVEKGNQDAVTSNAVAIAIPEVIDEVKLDEQSPVTSNAVANICATIIKLIPSVVDVVEEDNDSAVTSNAVAKAISKDIPTIVDVVEKGNMSGVTSNAVAEAISGETPVLVSDVTINVKDKTLQSPIENAIVKIEQINNTTDSEGLCTFKDVEYGVHVLKITHNNYSDFIEGIKVSEVSQEFTIELEGSTVEYGDLNVSVFDEETSNPIESAVVKLGNETQKTNSEGKCSFTNIKYGIYNINITYENYDEYTDIINIDSSEINYSAKLIPTSIETSTVNVTVTDTSDIPLPDAKVIINNITHVTNTEGKCSFNLPYDDYTIKITCNNYEEYTDNITVASEKIEYTAILTQISTYTFKGEIIDEQGALDNVTVSYDVYNTITDSEGQYELQIDKNTNINTIPISFNKSYYNSVTVEVPVKEDVSTYVLDTQTLELSEYPANSNIVAITKNNKYDGEGYEISNNVNFVLEHVNTSDRYSYTSDDYGQVFAEDINAGKYNFIVSNNEIYKDEKQTDVFFVRPEQTLNDIDLIVTKLIHEFTLTLRRTNRTFITDTKVDILGEDKEILTTGTTNEYGGLTFNVINEQVQTLYVRVYLPNTDIVITEIGSSSLTNANVIIDDSYETGKLNITVIDLGTGLAVENANVQIGDTYSGITDSSGKCNFPRIKYDEYILKINCDGYNEYTDTITIESEETDYNVDLVEEGKHKFSLQVLWKADETPAYDKKIGIHQQGNEEIIAKGTTGNTGYFNFIIDDEPEIILESRLYSWNEEITSDQYIGSSKLTSATILIDSIDMICNLTIHVKDKPGTSLANANVKFDDSCYTTDEEGNCSIEAPYGIHNLIASYDGYFDYESEVEINSTEQIIEVSLTAEIYYGRFHVNDKDSGLAVKDATVVLGSNEAPTDDNGIANIIIPEREVPYAYSVISDYYNTYEGVVTAYEPVTDVYVEFQQANAIRFIVKDADTEKYVVGAKVIIEGTYGYTDDNGECLLTHIELGDHTYGIFHDDYEDIVDDIHISDTTTIVHIDMTHKKGDVTIVAVNSITKEPAEDILVKLTEEVDEDPLILSGTTDSNGECTFLDVKYATYTTLLKHDYYIVDKDHITVNTNPFKYEIPLICRRSDVTFKFIDNSTEEPIENVQLTFGEYTGISDENGECTLTCIYTSSYTTYHLVTYHDDYYDYVEKNVEINSAKQTITTKLERGYSTVSITVFDESTGLTVNNADVIMDEISGTTSFEGICTLRNVPYSTSSKILITHPCYDNYKDYVTIHDSECSYDINITTSLSRGECTFRVSDVETGDLIDDMDVYVDNIKGTTSLGLCTIQNVIYGAHSLKIGGEGYKTYDTTITVRKPSTTWPVVLYKATGNLEVCVEGTDNNLYVSGAIVTIDDKEATTDEEGKCYFEDITYGTWTCTVTHPYYIPYMGEAVINTTQNYKGIGLPSKYGKVIVTVIDDSTEEPVIDSNVFIDNNIETVDSEGKATFESIYYDDNHKLKVTNSYYQTKETTISVTGEETEMTVKITHW